MTVKTYCLTADPALWALRPFCYFAQTYYPSADITIAGFNPPPFEIPYPFHSIGKFSAYPYSKWSIGLRDLLNQITDEIFVLLLEDFWMYRMVDAEAIELLGEFMRANPHVARVDLTTDRLYADNVRDIGAWGRLDMITNDPYATYTCSFQPGIWRRTELLRVLTETENPHEVEMRGTERMIKAGQVVVGTRQSPVRICIAVQNGVIAIPPLPNYQVPPPIIHPDDLEAIKQWIP